MSAFVNGIDRQSNRELDDRNNRQQDRGLSDPRFERRIIGVMLKGHFGRYNVVLMLHVY
jgi:hypothetical protein